MWAVSEKVNLKRDHRWESDGLDSNYSSLRTNQTRSDLRPNLAITVW